MRVLAIAPWFPSRKRPGAGVFAERDAELLNRDHDVTVIHLADPDDLAPDEPREVETGSGLRIIRAAYRPYHPGEMRDAVRLIRAELRSAEVIHTMAMHSLVPARLARPSVPWVHTEHWSALLDRPSSAKKRLGRWLYRSSLKAPGTVIAVGQDLAHAIERVRRREVPVIGNHVPVGHTHSLPTSPEERGSAPLRLIAIGGLIDRKGPLQAIEAVSALRTRGIVATLDWVGNGPLEAAVHDRIDALDLNRSVSLLGQMSPQRIPELLRQAHLFVLPTSVETFGVAFAEALGQGLPVVATGRGGHLDFLPSSASRVVSTRTGEAIADAIVSLSTDPHRWSASRILEYAGDRFSDERRREAYAEIYRSLLS